MAQTYRIPTDDRCGIETTIDVYAANVNTALDHAHRIIRARRISDVVSYAFACVVAAVLLATLIYGAWALTATH